MDVIFIDNLVFSGTHGVNPEEQRLSQRFSVSVRMEFPTEEASKSDKLKDTVDYARTRDLIRSIVEGERNYLIERMGHRIATGILEDQRIKKCEVTIKKLDVWGNGTPGVVIERGR